MTSIVVTLVIAILTVAANAIVNTTIRFAPDKETAKDELKQHGVTVLRWLTAIFWAWVLASNMFSPEPLTRARVFAIALGVAFLLFILTMALLQRHMDGVWNALLRIQESRIQDAKALGKHIELTERKVDAVRNQATSKEPGTPKQ